MPDSFGIIEGANALSSSIKESTEASKALSEAITGVIDEAEKAAKVRANSRKKNREVHPDTQTVVEATEEWQRLLVAKKSEDKIKYQIVAKYGERAWQEIVTIKNRKIWEQQQDKRIYAIERKRAKAVMALCYIGAVYVAWYLTWGYK